MNATEYKRNDAGGKDGADHARDDHCRRCCARPYSAVSARTMMRLRPREVIFPPATRSPRLASAGHAFQLISVSIADKAPRPYQLCARPCCSSSGTSVPDAATPRPTPAKMTPPTTPRLPGAVCGKMVEAASTMITPPLNPARKRHPKNQMNDNAS